MAGGCSRINNEQVECNIKGIQAGKKASEFVQYDVPTVSAPLEIFGSVTLVGEQLAPVAKYSTTVKP